MVAFVLHATNYGSLYKSEFIQHFRASSIDKAAHSAVINEFSKSANMLHVEPAGDGETSNISFDITMRKDKEPRELTRQLDKVEGVSDVVLVASKNDVDY